MTEDRLFSAIKSIVRRILNDSNEIDYKALYPAKVVMWQSSGLNPSGTVDVNFVDSRLNSATAVPVLPPVPGTSYKPQQGTQCLVGWYGGDETSPYATGWPGEGGSLETVIAATTKVDVTAATVNLGSGVGTQTVVLQPIVPALTTVLTAVGTFATAVGAAVPALITPAATLNTAIGVFVSGTSTYTTTKTKAS